jgi:hypothetical protein
MIAVACGGGGAIVWLRCIAQRMVGGAVVDSGAV